MHSENLPFFQLPLDPENCYNVRYKRTIIDRVRTTSTMVFDSSSEDISNTIRAEYNDLYKNDPGYVLLSINCEMYDLPARIKAMREMFELGHKVRAETKIRNRQPLRKAYILFSDPKIQDFMRYIDCGKKEYADRFANELNIFDVEFIEGNLDRFFYYVMKPNFRLLGQKGFGKQAQELKAKLMEMDFDKRAEMLAALKVAPIDMCGISIAEEDIEVEYVARTGFVGANGKVGSIILDTTLDDALKEHGTVADFKSSIQNIRKLGKLDITDNIELEIYCSVPKMTTLMNHINKLKKDLLTRNITFYGGKHDGIQFDDKKAFKFKLDEEDIAVMIYKVL